LGVTVAQVAIGIYQARNGLPELAVGIHMVLAAVLVALVTTLLLAQKQNSAQEDVLRPLQEHAPATRG